MNGTKRFAALYIGLAAVSTLGLIGYFTASLQLAPQAAQENATPTATPDA